MSGTPYMQAAYTQAQATRRAFLCGDRLEHKVHWASPKGECWVWDVAAWAWVRA